MLNNTDGGNLWLNPHVSQAAFSTVGFGRFLHIAQLLSGKIGWSWSVHVNYMLTNDVTTVLTRLFLIYGSVILTLNLGLVIGYFLQKYWNPWGWSELA